MSRAGSVSARRGLLLALIAPIAAFELYVSWLALHPNVSDNYRAYYIDKTTTCLDKGSTGTYRLGQTVSFLPDDMPGAWRLRVCGWDGPVGNGTHSVGTRSMLRFALDRPPHDLTLRMLIMAIDAPDHRAQRVLVSGNGVPLGETTIPAGAGETVDFRIPDSAFADRQDRLDVALDYPNAAEMVPHDSDTHFRAIRLLSVQLRRPQDPASAGPQDDPATQRFRDGAG